MPVQLIRLKRPKPAQLTHKTLQTCLVVSKIALDAAAQLMRMQGQSEVSAPPA